MQVWSYGYQMLRFAVNRTASALPTLSVSGLAHTESNREIRLTGELADNACLPQGVLAAARAWSWQVTLIEPNLQKDLPPVPIGNAAFDLPQQTVAEVHAAIGSAALAQRTLVVPPRALRGGYRYWFRVDSEFPVCRCWFRLWVAFPSKRGLCLFPGWEQSNGVRHTSANATVDVDMPALSASLAGGDRGVTSGQAVTLDASASFDPAVAAVRNSASTANIYYHW